MANAYREMGRYDEAMIAFQAALQIAEAMDSQVLQARILNNLGALHAANAAYDEADEVIDRAFALFEGREAGEWSRFLYGVRAQTALGRGELETARDDIQRTFEGVPLEASTQPFTDFHETAVEIYTGLGQFERALEHAQAFKRLEDAARDIAASANTALLAAQFEFTEQELQINQLRTTGLEQDLALATAPQPDPADRRRGGPGPHFWRLAVQPVSLPGVQRASGDPRKRALYRRHDGASLSQRAGACARKGRGAGS